MSMVYMRVAITLSVLIAADAKPAKNELAKLRGTWLTVSLMSDGKTLVDEKTPPMPGHSTTLVYEGDQWMIQVGDKTVAKGKFKVDATKTPNEIDVFDESGLMNEKTKRGIYQISGDTYRFCLALAGQARPTEFTSKPGSGHSLGVSKRAKP